MHTLIPLYKISNYLVHLHALILINTIIILFFVHYFTAHSPQLRKLQKAFAIRCILKISKKIQ